MCLRIENLSKSYGRRTILTGLSVSLQKGQCLGILGASGSGKTTLLRIIAGLERADSGSVTFDGTIFCDEGGYLPPWQRGVGFVFQDLALWPHMTALENVGFMFPGRMNRLKRKQKAAEVLMKVHLTQAHNERYPDELSGGECQRVAIARALAMQSRLLLMDEPFAHLDAGLKGELLRLVEELRRLDEITVVYVSHTEAEVVRLADSIGVLENGCLKSRT